LKKQSFDSLSLSYKLIRVFSVLCLTVYALFVNAQNCNTSTFYLHLSPNPGQKIELRKIQTLPNTDFVLAGNTIFSDRHKEGLLISIGNNGALKFQKQIRIDNLPTIIEDSKIIANGDVFITGIIDDGSNDVFAALFDSNFSTKWVQKLHMSSATIKTTADIIDVIPPLSFTMAVQLNNSVDAIFLNGDGSLKWSSQVNLPGLTELVGLSDYSFSPLSLIANCTIGGISTTVISELDYNNGQVNSSSLLDDGTWQSRTLSTTAFDGNMRMLGIRKNSSNQFEIFRNNLRGTIALEYKHLYTVPFNIDFSSTAAMDNAGDALGIVAPSDGKLLFIKHFAYYQTFPEHIRSYDVPVGASIRSAARGFDAGYLFGMNVEDSSEIVLIKTDSIGVLGGCGYADVSAKYIEELNKSTYTTSLSSAAVSTPVISSSASFAANSFNTNFDCQQSYCPEPPLEDSCLSSFFKTYKSNNYSESFSEYFLMRNHFHLVSVDRHDRVIGTGTSVSSGIKLLDEKGKFIKGVTTFQNGVYASKDLTKMTDSTIMMESYSVQNNIPCYTFTLLDDKLNIKWSKSIKTFSGFGFTSNGLFLNVCTDSEGNYYFFGTQNGFLQPAGIMILKLDANGNQLWLRSYTFPSSAMGNASGIATASSLIIVGEGSDGSVSMRFDKNNGAILGSYLSKNKWSGELYKRLLTYDQGKIFYAGSVHNGNFLMGLYDTLARPLRFEEITNSSILRAATVKDGKLYGAYSGFDGSRYVEVLFKADTSLTVEFMNQYDPLVYGYPSGMGVDDNGFIYQGGNYFWQQYYDAFLRKYDPNGAMGTCNFTPVTPNLSAFDVSTQPLNFTEVPINIVPVSIPVSFVDDANAPAISGVLCASVNQCHFIQLSGPASVCQLNKPYLFKTLKDPLCQLVPKWEVDTSALSIEQITDSAATIIFKKSGSYWLHANLNAGCTSYSDSIEVKVYNAPSQINLGNDTTICPDNILLLNAGTGFASYTWNDGSADSIFKVSAPGNYFVAVQDGCGIVLHDTIVVAPHAPIPFNPLMDRFKCNSDTLRLRMDTTFINYEWTPNYKISATNSSSVVVNPDKDTSYFVKAEKTPGCFAYDTVRITVFHSPAINLGNDTSFCKNQLLQLNAGNGFAGYLWSNGAQSKEISVGAQGTYSVNATTSEGCISSDTLIVNSVWTLPAITLDHNPALCMGSSKILDPGNFASYVWQDGSTNRSFTANSTGDYYVTVSDIHHCENSDTVHIVQILPLPGNFLSQDTAICSYSSLTIGPEQSFNSYFWSNGSSSRLITVEKAGQYWLVVKDANNCIGKDTINIGLKECMVGLYVPTAFTPNRDGINDNFRALVFGNVKSFEFTVYDRWGKIVFQTYDRSKGWDGKRDGVDQSSNVYVWTCRYRLEGQEEKISKGTVMLIR
jgi:gliding motility-associated-like protein